MPFHNEVPIMVFAEDLNDPNSVVVVPDEAYVISNKQKPHWVSWQGEVVDVEFEKASGSPEKPACNRGHAKSKSHPLTPGSYKYTVSLRVNGKIYKGDPRLVVGN
ncbi:MAG: hypothetical protein LAO21_15840 [Acidobacteriia bacterium]|nr:hypothetical protein [Terriglobia bacterium]